MFKINDMLMLQDELDKAIFEKAGVEDRSNVINDLRLAYVVELGELCNEWQQFKYWKKNITVDRSKLLAEWADVLHFALSIELYSIENVRKSDVIKYLDCVDNYINFAGKRNFKKDTYECLNNCYKLFGTSYGALIHHVFDLGFSLDFTLLELVNAYETKRQINFERVNNGY